MYDYEHSAQELGTHKLYYLKRYTFWIDHHDLDKAALYTGKLLKQITQINFTGAEAEEKTSSRVMLITIWIHTSFTVELIIA